MIVSQLSFPKLDQGQFRLILYHLVFMVSFIFSYLVNLEMEEKEES